MSRRSRLALAVVGALLALDAARSISAHRAYLQPVSAWMPTREVELSWPPGLEVPSNTSLGGRVFAQHCAVCHGPQGKGNGPASPSLHPKPRDFTAGEFKFKSTPAGQPPTDDDLLRTVRDGLAASAMPYFSDVLSADEVRAVVQEVKRMAQISNGAVAISGPPPGKANTQRGGELYVRQGCVGCHGEDGHLRKAFEDANGSSFWAPDLTQPWTFHGGSSPERIYVRLTTGILPGPMPSYAESMTPEERWDVANYVVSLRAPAPWEAGGKLSGLGQHPDPLRRGEYLARTEMCQLCHTLISPRGVYREQDMRLAGGMGIRTWPHGVQVSRNLTGDETTGLGRYTEQQVVDILHLGHEPDRQLSLWAMPWPVFHELTDSDTRSLVKYLKSTPGVKHPIPTVVHFGIIETLVAKIARGLPAAPPPKLEYFDGDFGSLASAEPLEKGLGWAQLAVLILGILSWIAAGPTGHRWPSGGWRWAGTLGVAFMLLVLGVVASVLFQLPAYDKVPPEQLISGILGGLPQVDRSPSTTPEQAQLAERGRYLFKVSSCAFCHGGSGAGGSKISWKPSGTLYVRNITSDVQTGIGGWTDAQIARAIRSGVSKDGRALHWQGMTWDLFSNYEEEDVRALVAFLRQLPAVSHPVAAPRRPAPNDCDVYSFFVQRDTPAGCRE